MRKVFSKLLAAIMIVLLSVSLFACGKTDENTILFYVWGNNNDVANIEKLISDFESKNEDIKVEIERATGTNVFDSLKTRFTSGSEPDMFFMDPNEINGFIEAGYIEPLDDYIAAEGGLELEDLWDFNDAYRYDENGVRDENGKLYGVIKDLSPDFMLVYNKDHIDEYNRANPDMPIEYPSETVPMTWYEYLDLARKMTIKNGDDYTRYGTLIDYVPIKHLSEWVQQTGSSLYNEDMTGLNIVNGEIDPKMKEAFQFLYDLQVSRDGYDAPGKYMATSLINSGDLFNTGNIFSVWYGRWAIPSYKWDLENMNIGFAPPPVPERVYGDERDNYGITSGMISYAMSSRTTKKDKCYRFIEYCMTDGGKIMADIGMNVPGNKTIAKNEFINVENEKIQKINRYFVDYLEKYTHPIINSPYISATKFDNILYQEMAKVYEGKQSLDAAIRAAHARVVTETSINLD
ncbi:MAG TPA: extracellular solute-binding protein [Candidatus Borkfalkia excrementigallinarum]|mgnify:CR=1 FL=1|uniref:Extracellular solute-binding protein n=1 Tax=Candidatus Borkfalkia excrementigallinarum TaxID=2838506 RepID=A0A9D1ZWQ8_9FIRM|nr:extracellular solute-binding protein [Candidatus Borkfalkia excrementigallinarum]